MGRAIHFNEEQLQTIKKLYTEQGYSQEKIAKILIENNIPFQRQYTFQDLLSPKNSVLKYDFYKWKIFLKTQVPQIFLHKKKP